MLSLRNKFKHLVLALGDAVLVGTSLYLALVLRFEGHTFLFMNNFERLLWPAVLLNIIIFCFGLYRRLWRYASVDELLLIVWAVGIGPTATFKPVFSPYAPPQRIYNLWGYSTFLSEVPVLLCGCW